jgi:hypothetical protein
VIFTTNKPLAAWGVVLHDPDLAEAILDRVLERGRVVELRGASYRTRHLKRTEPDRSRLQEGARISGIPGPDFPEPAAPDERNKIIEGIAKRGARMVLTIGDLAATAGSPSGTGASVFLDEFIDVLQANVGILPGLDMFSRLRLRFVDSKHMLEYGPMKYAGHEGGDFLFVRTR